ncbi:TolB family protein [Nocardia rhizosphaerihabitans]|uniref:TolB family protein n=1 Tax=Nocardia rhizosphaerihabitans TaxID=1691570 RepID=UPI0016679625|nr:hypothetical protein [Nocardia rhizosphaerihabitans]
MSLRVAVGGMPLQLVDPDGTGAVTLTDDGWDPEFSADGTQLLVTRFTEDAPNGLRSEIWVMNSDGSNPRRLTRSAG